MTLFLTLCFICWVCQRVFAHLTKPEKTEGATKK